MDKLSKEYHSRVALATKHHADSKTYSGLMLRPHAAYLKGMIDDLNVTSIIDYGCGKGLQYEWVSHDTSTGVPKGMTIEEFWGVKVDKYDSCYPPFAKEPEGKFDLVICTHTLGSIPVKDRDTIIRRIYSMANKGVFIAEKIGKPKKNVFKLNDTKELELTKEGWWNILYDVYMDMEIYEGFHYPKVILSTRVKTKDGAVVERVEVP